MTAFGWCLDGHHALCRREYTSQVGVAQRCGCDCHDEEED